MSTERYVVVDGREHEESKLERIDRLRCDVCGKYGERDQLLLYQGELWSWPSSYHYSVDVHGQCVSGLEGAIRAHIQRHYSVLL